MDKKKFGAKIQAARQAKNMTVDQLADCCLVSTATIRHIEIGAKGVSMDLFICLCDVLEVTPEYLLKNEINHFVYESQHISFSYLSKMSQKQKDLLAGVFKSIIDSE